MLVERKSKQTEPELMSLPLNHLSYCDPLRSGFLPFSLGAFSCSRLLEELLLEEDSLEDDFEFELCDLLLEELLLLLLPVL